LLDTGAFAENRYFDVFTEYAKASAEDILIKVTVANRGPAEADLSLLPTIWFRNTWSWGRDDYRPALRAIQQLSIPKEYGIPGSGVIAVEHKTHGKRWLSAKENLNFSSPRMKRMRGSCLEARIAHPTSKTESTTTSCMEIVMPLILKRSGQKLLRSTVCAWPLALRRRCACA